jgi:phytoene dehydrogenase-like protein
MALAVPGTLTAALRRASNAELQTDCTVAEILVTRGRAVGVRLQGGETIGARAVLSSRTRGASAALAGLERPQTFSEAGDARIVFTLGEGVTLPPALAAGRCVAALPPADCADAHEAARAGRLPRLVPFAVTAETPRSLVVDLPLMPVSPPEGWTALKAPLAAGLIKTLSRQVPGLARALTGVTVTPPRLRPRASLAQLLAPAFERAVTRVPGLYLCGEDAEPVPCVSGRAGRFAAHFALKSR